MLRDRLRRQPRVNTTIHAPAVKARLALATIDGLTALYRISALS